MTNDEATKLARDLMPRNAGIAVLVTSADLKRLCHAILSGDIKREIENAAYERAANLADDYCGTECEGTARYIRALITPAKSADTER